MKNDFDSKSDFPDCSGPPDCDFLVNYLSWIDKSPIMLILETLFPSCQTRKWVYSPLLLLKLLILQDKKNKLPYISFNPYC